MTELLEIDPNECWELLAQCTVGRLAVNLDHRGPLVVPVNFVVVDGYVVFRSDPGTKLGLIEAGPIGFQVDSIDHGRHTGWSVLVRGVAHEADEWEVRDIELDPWAGGEKAHWVRLLPTAITGRRVVAGDLPYDDRGYR